MFKFFRHLFSTEGFPPRWHCGVWSSLHGWVHICSDAAIFGAYAAIPITLAYFALKRKDVPFLPIFWLFGAFILACGAGHLIEATIFWHPWYRLSGAVKLVTAVVSWGTVVALIRIVPKALLLPGLAKVNEKLTREIAEREKTLSELRCIKAAESAMLDAAPDAIISIDAEGRVVAWNHSAERIFGYSAAEARGRRVGDLIVPAALREQHRADFQVTGGGEPNLPSQRREMQMTRADGTELLVEFFITRIAADGPARFIAYLRDITERRLNEVQHQQAEERFRIVVEAAPSAILMVDARGKMMLVNSQTERLFGYPRNELLCQSVEMLVPERYRAAHPNHRGLFFGAPSAREMGAGRDLFGRRKDGAEVPIEIGLNPVHTKEGAFVLASIIDITERKHSEAQREAALEETQMLLREVHHRVKNNMQVISSLLRLHARKLHDGVQKGVFVECQERIRVMSLITNDCMAQASSLGSNSAATSPR